MIKKDYFVNKCPFFVMFGKDIGLKIVDFTPSKMAKQLGNNLMSVVKL